MKICLISMSLFFILFVTFILRKTKIIVLDKTDNEVNKKISIVTNKMSKTKLQEYYKVICNCEELWEFLADNPDKEKKDFPRYAALGLGPQSDYCELCTFLHAKGTPDPYAVMYVF